MQVIEIFADAQDSTLAMHVAGKALAIEASMSACVEDIARGLPHRATHAVTRSANPGLYHFAQFAQAAFEEMVGAFDHDQLLRFR